MTDLKSRLRLVASNSPLLFYDHVPISLYLLGIFPSTCLYDAVFFEEQDEEGRRFQMVRALIWEPGSFLFTISYALIDGASWYVWPPEWAYGYIYGYYGYEYRLSPPRGVIDVYSTKYSIVKGPLKEIPDYLPPEVDPNEFKETQRQEALEKMKQLMVATIPAGFTVEQTFVVTPVLRVEPTMSYICWQNELIPVKITRTQTIFARINYEHEFDHCPFTTQEQLQNARHRFLLLG